MLSYRTSQYCDGVSFLRFARCSFMYLKPEFTSESGTLIEFGLIWCIQWFGTIWFNMVWYEILWCGSIWFGLYYSIVEAPLQEATLSAGRSCRQQNQPCFVPNSPHSCLFQTLATLLSVCLVWSSATHVTCRVPIQMCSVVGCFVTPAV